MALDDAAHFTHTYMYTEGSCVYTYNGMYHIHVHVTPVRHEKMIALECTIVIAAFIWWAKFFKYGQ